MGGFVLLQIFSLTILFHNMFKVRRNELLGSIQVENPPRIPS